MYLSVAFLPHLLPKPLQDVCVVVDVLRASSTLVTMFDRGCRSVVVTPDVASARAVLAGDRLLCGEQGGLPPEGFHHGNSPVEMAQLDLSGRDAVFCTTNGTVALHAVQAAPAVLVGALLNRRAVADAALKLAAERATGVTVVCAGRYGGRVFALDDAFCAGAIVAALAEAAAAGGSPPELDDAALGALAICRPGGGQAAAGETAEAMHARALDAFRRSHGGRSLVKIGLEHDIDHCARVDRSATVPRLALVERELVLTPLR